MSRRTSRVQGLHAQEDGDEVNPRNQAPLNVAPEAPENGQLGSAQGQPIHVVQNFYDRSIVYLW